MPPDNTALAPLQRHSALRVQQKKEWGEILLGFEGRNRYQVVGDNGEPLYFAGEVGSGAGLFLLRMFLKASRPFTMELKSPSGVTALRVRRPWRFWLSCADIEDGEGRLLGSVKQRFSLFTKRYDVLGPSGEVLAQLRGPLFKPWTFIIEESGREVGRIQKRWSGFGKEMFTDADNFGVTFSDLHNAQLRVLAVGATFLLDFVHFENHGG
jgi:uncharacterized protein YxjI